MNISGETKAAAFRGRRAETPSVYTPPFIERYTEAARNVLSFAWAGALRRDSALISAADLLSGLSEEEGTRAERVGNLKANAFYLRWLSGLPALPSPVSSSIAASEVPDQANPDQASQLDFDAEAKRALAFAVLEADRDREYWIDTDHLLRGLLRFPNKAHFAVLKTEINLDAARIASRHDREKFPSKQTPSLKVARYLIRKHLVLWAPPILGLLCYLYILFQSVGTELSPLAR